MITLDQNMGREKNYVIQIVITLLLILYQKIFLENISYDSEKWFDMSNYNKKDKIPLPIRKNKKLAGLFKDKLGGKITTEFVALIPKAY